MDAENRWFLDLMKEESLAQMYLRLRPGFRLKPRKTPYDRAANLHRRLGE